MRDVRVLGCGCCRAACGKPRSTKLSSPQRASAATGGTTCGSGWSHIRQNKLLLGYSLLRSKFRTEDFQRLRDADARQQSAHKGSPGRTGEQWSHTHDSPKGGPAGVTLSLQSRRPTQRHARRSMAATPGSPECAESLWHLSGSALADAPPFLPRSSGTPLRPSTPERGTQPPGRRVPEHRTHARAPTRRAITAARIRASPRTVDTGRISAPVTLAAAAVNRTAARLELGAGAQSATWLPPRAWSLASPSSQTRIVRSRMRFSLRRSLMAMRAFRGSAENMKPSAMSAMSSSSLCGYSRSAVRQPSLSAACAARSLTSEIGSLYASSSRDAASPGRTQQRRRNSTSSEE
eukprot:3752842-Prymnesium_polylepis.1